MSEATAVPTMAQQPLSYVDIFEGMLFIFVFLSRSQAFLCLKTWRLFYLNLTATVVPAVLQPLSYVWIFLCLFSSLQ